jgi:ribonuclease P protein component
MRFTFRREERLRSRRAIRQLYQTGVSGFLYPFRYSYIAMADTGSVAPAELLIAVSRKRLPKAVDRNLIRRRIREAYRTNKHLLYNPLTAQQLHLAIIITYIGQSTESWEMIEKKLVLLLQEIPKRLAVAESNKSKSSQ